MEHRTNGWTILTAMTAILLGGCEGGNDHGRDEDDEVKSLPPPVAGGWTKVGDKPVLDVGAPGAWDDDSVSFPHVLKINAASYRMWYEGDDSATWTSRIGLAFSSDGVTWSKYGVPVLNPGPAGSWDEERVGKPCVYWDGSSYRMWYEGEDGFWGWRIGYATSSNGSSWTQSAFPVLGPGPAGSWDSLGVGSPQVIWDSGVFKMWYSGMNDSFVTGIGYATSSNGITWTKYAGNPVLSPGSPGHWDSLAVGEPSVIRDGASLRLWYSGQASFDFSLIGHAESANGIGWTKSPANPVLGGGVASGWEESGPLSSCVLRDGSKLQMWYAAEDANGAVRIGLAVSP